MEGEAVKDGGLVVLDSVGCGGLPALLEFVFKGVSGLLDFLKDDGDWFLELLLLG